MHNRFFVSIFRRYNNKRIDDEIEDFAIKTNIVMREMDKCPKWIIDIQQLF